MNRLWNGYALISIASNLKDAFILTNIRHSSSLQQIPSIFPFLFHSIGYVAVSSLWFSAFFHVFLASILFSLCVIVVRSIGIGPWKLFLPATQIVVVIVVVVPIVFLVVWLFSVAFPADSALFDSDCFFLAVHLFRALSARLLCVPESTCIINRAFASADFKCIVKFPEISLEACVLYLYRCDVKRSNC